MHDRFTLTNDQFDLDGCRIRIPNLGWVRMRETLRFVGKLMSATISRVANRWFVSITVNTPFLRVVLFDLAGACLTFHSRWVVASNFSNETR